MAGSGKENGKDWPKLGDWIAPGIIIALVAFAYNSLSGQVAGVSSRVDRLESQISKLDEKVDRRGEAIERRFVETNQRIDRVLEQLAATSTQIGKLEGELGYVRSRLDRIGERLQISALSPSGSRATEAMVPPSPAAPSPAAPATSPAATSPAATSPASAAPQTPTAPLRAPSPVMIPATPLTPAVPIATTSPSGQLNFVTKQTSGQFLQTKFKGTDVIGTDDKKIGDVSDILFDKDKKILAYIVGVGGFLGIGAKDVAIDPASFQMVPGKDANDFKLRLSMTKDELKAAPAFEPYSPPRPVSSQNAPTRPMGAPSPTTPPVKQ